MKKFLKKSKYLLISSIVFFISIVLSSKWMGSPIEKAMADAPECLAPNQQFTNGCFTPSQQQDWIVRGGDTGGGGDSAGGAGAAGT